MTDKALVPPDTAGWIVRVGTPPSAEEFFVVAIPDETAAVAAVAAHVGAKASDAVEGVATLSQKGLAEHNLKPGQIKHT